ncbi:hypothetical protein A8L34_05085 [Bacillus sp. FJAT-27264]|uniref:hypothetical protein n=1 Tax=Paenibacillus sp. (strain DSM 101736 / FJAT-27264) TaxID=1850362 RepID=UPI000807F934|nr:hypothetical protein [Bacillus sp. FJAT-27264]OBZ18925.1 hypothetical protein A8L34_05085 [Bacillus sp. FJAT-27264]
MEYIFKADLFNLDLANQIYLAMLPVITELKKEDNYALTISFHVDLLNDSRMDHVEVPLKKWETSETRKDKIYQLLGFQLEKIDELLCNEGLKVISSTIQGEKLEFNDIIKILLSLKEQKHNPTEKRKTNKPLKVKSVVPSLPYTQDIIFDFASERLSKMYIDLMKIVRSKKLMSEILEIEVTEDEKKIYSAFCEQYGELWLPTDDTKQALFDKLRKRVEEVSEKQSDKEHSEM